MANLVSIPGAAAVFSTCITPQVKQRLSLTNEKICPTAVPSSSREPDSNLLKPAARPHPRDRIRIGIFRHGLRNSGIACADAQRKRTSLEAKLYGITRENETRGNVAVSQKLADEDEIVELPASLDSISSPGNAYVKHLAKLRTSAKARSASRSVMVVGAIPLREICCSSVPGRGLNPKPQPRKGLNPKSQPRIDVLLVRQGAEISAGLAAVSRRIVRVSPAAMSKLSGLESPPEVVGVLGFPSTFCAFESMPGAHAAEGIVTVMEQNWCHSPRRILVLDCIQDPGNLGTLLRTVAAFSWDAVFLLPGCCDPFNDKALRAARGASFQVPVASGLWVQVREFAVAKKLKLYAGDPEPDSGDASGNGGLTLESGLVGAGKPVLGDGEGLCLVLGSEGQGISEEVRKDCAPIGIAMPGDFESLNVAVAGGILMFALS